MLKKLVLLSALPLGLLALAQPAEARRLFWWEAVNTDGGQPGYYDAQQDVYADPYGGYGTPQDRFNERQYELYRREMARRYGSAAYQDQGAGYGNDYSYDGPPPPYADPLYPQPRKLVKKKPIITSKPFVKAAAKPVAPATTDTPATTASITPAPAKTKATGGVSCDKGQGIVSSFGFSNVASKSCAGKSLVYSAERGGNKFEVEVNPVSGELTAVRKL